MRVLYSVSANWERKRYQEIRLVHWNMSLCPIFFTDTRTGPIESEPLHLAVNQAWRVLSAMFLGQRYTPEPHAQARSNIKF